MKQKYEKTFTCSLVLVCIVVVFVRNDLKGQACPGLDNITLNVVARPLPTLSAPAQICSGGSGTISVNQSFSSYAWNTGDASQSIPISNSGTYTVTVTNAAGCSNTASVNVGMAPNLTLNITQAAYACNGQLTLNAGAGYSNYQWSNGGSAATTSAATSGTYTVTVTNAQGCTGTDTHFANIPTAPVVNITGQATFCTGTSTSLSASPGLSSYSWSSGQTGANINVVNGGTFTVTATDAFGCTATDNFMLSALATPAPVITGPASICSGTSATFVTSTSFPGYSWSNGQSTPSITVSTAGTYTVTVTAVNGCTGTDTQSFAITASPTPNITQAAYTCNSQLTLNAGAGYSSYQWSDGGSTATTSVNTTGTYTVTVTNAQGCTGTDTHLANIPSAPVVNITGQATFCSGTSTSLSASPGLSSYSWSSGQTGANINVVNGGTFTVTATDALGCTATDNFILSAMPSPAPVITGPASICSGTTATFNTSTNFPGYSWSNGQNTPSITVSTAGTYTITVTAANGCTGTDTQLLAITASPAPNITQAAYACNSQLTLNTGAGYSSYAWSTGGSGVSTSVTTSGTYTVTVTNAQGCTGTNTFNASIPVAPTVTITGAVSFCTGTSSGLNASPGLSAYSWSSGQSGQNINVVNGGTFTVTATDALGCTATDNFTLSALTSPVPVITGPASVCSGTSATFITSTSFPGYSWSNGQTTASISASTAGTYTVTVTAANGCTGTDTQLLAITASPTPNIAQATYLCNGQLTLNGGAGFSVYAWSNGGNSSSTTVAASGTYTVTVTNAQGCTGTDSHLASIPVQPLVNISGGTNICPGSSTTLTATPGFSSYHWSTNANNLSIVVPTGGNYSVTATDASGCTATNVASVNVLAAPMPNISGPTQICASSNAVFSVPGSFTAYNWSIGATTPTISVGAAGTYTVTVTAANGCTNTDTQTLSISNNLQPQITQLPYNCNGQLSFDAGSGFSSYQWSSSQNTQSITVATGGSYSVTVSDGGGCTGSAVVSAVIPSPPTVNITGNSTICTGTSTTLSATNNLSNYVWNNGHIGPTLNVTTGGTYTVTASDAFGCTVSKNFTLTSTPLPIPNITGPSVICTNSSGMLTLSSAFSQYTWSTGAHTQGITILAGNTYAVTVTDAQGCTGTDSQIVTEATGLAPTITPQAYACNGVRTLSAGNGFSTYTWSNGQNTPIISVITQGTYSVTVTDATGCTGTDLLAVTIPTAPNVQISGTNSFCQSANTTLTATPGFLNYAWSNGSSSNNITVTIGSLYTVTVTDNLGCTDTESLTVTAFPLPQPLISGPSVICTNSSATLSLNNTYSQYQWSTGANTASISITSGNVYAVTVTDAQGCTGTNGQTVTEASSLAPIVTALTYTCNGIQTLDAGSGFNTYTWSGGQSTPAISVTNGGTYSVTVTDATGCTGADDISVVIPTAPNVQISGVNSFCQNENTTLTATSGFSSYSWSNGESFDQVVVSIGTTYTVTVTDNFGCTDTESLMVTAFPLPQPAITGPNVICTNSSGTLALSSSYSQYNWSTGVNTANIVINAGNMYAVTVTDAQGCTGSDALQVTEATSLAPTVNQLAYACNGVQTLDAGTGFSTYIWSGGQNTATISVNSAGTYTVTVTDATGCSGTDAMTVTIPAAPNVLISGVNSFCQNENTTLTASPGFSTYLWSNGESFDTVTVSIGSTYTVTVTDNLGCTDTESLFVTALQLPQPQITGPSVICTNSTGALALSSAFGQYNWSTGDITSSITITSGNTYLVTVTDVQGCTGTGTYTVTESTSLSPVVSMLNYACNSMQTLDAGSGYSTYTWSNGQQTETVSVNTAGTYSVTVTDVSGCSGSDAITVDIPTAPNVLISGTSSFCQNDNTTLDATPGFVTYAWSTGDLSSGVSVNQGGVFTVTVTDNLGCSDTESVTVTAIQLPQPQIISPASNCAGDQVSLTVNQNFASYLWSTGNVASSINSNTPGIFSVTVTDANGCSGTGNTTLSFNQNPAPAIAEAPYACNGQITLNAGAGYSIYNWTGPNLFTSASAQPAVSASGNYVVTVTDANGCTGTATQLTSVPALSQVSISGASQICPAQSTTLTAANGFNAYIWSNGTATSAINVATAGSYTVTATDALGCTVTSTQAVAALSPPVPVISGPATICGSNPLNLNVSGGAFNGILWSNAATSAGTSINAAGVYSVTVTGTNGCTAATQTTIQPGGSLSANVTALPYACNGQVTLNATGGFAQYLWSNGSITQTANVAQTGTYAVTVTDAGGCSGTASIQANVPTTVTPQLNATPKLCAGTSIALALSNPQNFVQFNWNNGSQVATSNISVAGTYTVTTTDALGCTGTATSIVQAAPLASVNIAATGTLCGSGGATFTTSGSAGSFAWSDGSTSSSLSITQAGTYFVTVTDANGCTATDTETVQAGTPVTTTLNRSSCRREEAGIETLTLTAASGCDSIVSIITSYDPIKPGLALDMDTKIQAKAGQEISLSVEGNFAIDSVAFQSPFTLSCSNCFDPMFKASVTGYIEVTAYDEDGCSASEKVLISVSKSLDVYVPTIFQPGSSQNGYFSVYAQSDISSVRNFSVFDRWGNALFSRADMPTNDPFAGWDGMFRNQFVLPGVYIYYFELVQSDGTKEVFSGDVTIVK